MIWPMQCRHCVGECNMLLCRLLWKNLESRSTWSREAHALGGSSCLSCMTKIPATASEKACDLNDNAAGTAQIHVRWKHPSKAHAQQPFNLLQVCNLHNLRKSTQRSAMQVGHTTGSGHINSKHVALKRKKLFRRQTMHCTALNSYGRGYSGTSNKSRTTLSFAQQWRNATVTKTLRMSRKKRLAVKARYAGGGSRAPSDFNVLGGKNTHQITAGNAGNQYGFSV